MKTRVDVDFVYLILYYGMTIEHDLIVTMMMTMMRKLMPSGLWWRVGAWDCKGLRPHKLNRITKQLG